MSNWKGIKNLTRSIIMSFFFYCEISLWFNTQTLFFLCYILACLLYIQHSISLYTIVCIYVFIYLFFPFFLSYMSSKYRIVCEIKKIKQQNKHVIRPRNWRRYSMERQRWEKKSPDMYGPIIVLAVIFEIKNLNKFFILLHFTFRSNTFIFRHKKESC